MSKITIRHLFSINLKEYITYLYKNIRNCKIGNFYGRFCRCLCYYCNYENINIVSSLIETKVRRKDLKLILSIYSFTGGNKLKKIFFISFVALVTLFSANTVYAGWEKSGSSWYYKNSSGSYHSGWLYDGGTWYYLESNGVMRTGWLYDKGTWYYMKSSGAMVTGWVSVGGTWYYLNSSGAMKTGWLYQGGSWYYLHSSGAMATGWIRDGGTWYYLKGSGAMATGWLLDGNKWYYLSGSGAMQTGWLKVGGATYYLNSSGTMLTGQQVIDGKAYVFSSSGALTASKVTGWVEEGSGWYYYKSDGTKAVGWLQIPNSQGVNEWYYFNSNGTMRTGWLQEGSTWYYFSANGSMQTGWATLAGKQYYFNPSGVMNTSAFTSGGVKYTFFPSGALKSSTYFTSYNQTLDEMVNIQFSVRAQTDLYRNDPSYVHKENITLVAGKPNQGKINGNSSIYVYEGTSKDSRVVGSIKADANSEAEVTIKATHGDWYEVAYGPWKNATHNDIKHYVNPSNFSAEDFQFLKLSQNTGISANELNNKILTNAGILSGKGQSFVNGSKQYNVNELYLISHALHETGHGTSPLSNGSIEVGVIDTNKYVSFHSGTAYIAEYFADTKTWTVTESENFDRSQAKNIKKTYNMFGIGAVDSAANTRGSVTAYQNGWFTPEAAIIGGAKFIGESYIHHSSYKQDTLYKMRWNPVKPGTHQYASDIGWATKQLDDLIEMYQLLDYYTLHFDVPVYK